MFVMMLHYNWVEKVLCIALYVCTCYSSAHMYQCSISLCILYNQTT